MSTGIDIALSVLTTIPKIIDIIDRHENKNNDEKIYRFLDVLERSMDLIVEADTEEKRHEAAFNLADAVRSIR